jgi:hypothetical protein
MRIGYKNILSELGRVVGEQGEKKRGKNGQPKGSKNSTHMMYMQEKARE